ncbi:MULTISPECIES: DUF4112 domain-containing protein [unclassified Methylophaga]|jgi:hypothetical protein|uniref:DUF4112 domain-containing protein n=1 Tax=unclassified Methylophaga TaxID=2629249 RepID=UPI000C8D1021|nr:MULTISPECIES: DUF4112 domain-containing protein [unclassified Methylophaga]MAK65923.1 hypothetical protein [Methylophaga sp.]MAY18700.1 hypothetical protein [Methylophaga sp.]THK42626.1 DUF4112 domain-containing protein [Methylophaga sp. SB9B]HAO25302.1 DUF4112 domain-containing protein [Methylophaga sp.]HCD06334.1 DUF4112 domain-containing protein [Methylophaga sp.]|tara:strand:+ start:2116 stop:2571 length:456 start_codon:yes stop_codon:yes gene_type:complete
MKTKSRFIERLSWFLDESIPLPGGYRIGLDGFIGLIPGIGDFIGGLLSSVIIYKAHQLGVPRMILGRMIINMVIDTVLGAIPVAGDVFDFVWKANKRNVVLLDDYQQQPKQVYRKSLIQNILFIGLLLGILVLLIVFISWIIGLLISAINN